MKTTLDLPADLLREMKFRAVSEGSSLKQVITDLLKRGLQAEQLPAPPPSSKAVQIAEDGLPLFKRTTKAPASRMTIEELLNLEKKALAAEDLTDAGLAD